MRDTDLFQMAPGLTPPWQVESCEFAAEQKRLDIRLAFPRGSVFVCPQCGQADLKAYDTTEKSWRHLNFFQHEAWLTAKLPRVNATIAASSRYPYPGRVQAAASPCCSRPWS